MFMDSFGNLLDCLSSKNGHSYIFGDFNLDVLKYSICNNVTNYIDLLYSHGFLQTVTLPTHCVNDSATIIDHCITNSDTYDYNSVILTTKISDHFPILFTLANTVQQKITKYINFRDFSEVNFNRFKSNLAAINWDSLYNTNDPQLAYDIFSETFLSLYNIHFPLNTKKFNIKYHRKDPWFTTGLLVSRREKFRLDKLASRSRCPDTLSRFKTYRNIYNRTVRAAKKAFFDSQFLKHQSNLKKTWQLLRSAINRKPQKSNSAISQIIVNGRSYTDPSQLANQFNEFFSTAPGSVADQINPFFNNLYERPSALPENIPIFKSADLQVSHEEIISAIANLESKTSLDLNEISMYFLKKCTNTILNPLKHVIDLSFRLGIVPSQLKIAKIIPIFKNGDPRSPDNYRPIALLSNFSKIFEKIMYVRLSNFLNVNKLLSDSQFGFRPEHSTVHPMVLFSNFITKAFNNKKHAIAIFCDLKKAFDTVNHKLLIDKMEKIGIRGLELLWFKNYLTGRKQYVHILGKNSDQVEILIGVPQGSILGPLLFLLFINDLPDCNLLLNLLFADDATLLAEGSDVAELYERVNNEFYKICCYFRKNLLSIHPIKTRYIVFSTSKCAKDYDGTISINNNNVDDLNNPINIHRISRVSGSQDDPAIKFLGLYIDPNFNFKYHVSQISNKISSALYFLRNAKSFLNVKALTSLYYSLIHTHIIYAIQIWSTCDNNSMQRIYKLQKKAIRIIHGLNYNGHTESYLKKSKILPLPLLIDFFRLQFMQQYVQGLLPTLFDLVWTTNSNRANRYYVLRNDEEFYIPPARITLTQKHPLHIFPQTWAAFDVHEIKIQREKIIFNSMLKLHFLNTLSTNYICSRLFCPSCHSNAT